MEQPQKAYSIFCDESCYLQFDDSDIMCIGAIIVPDADRDTYKFEIKRIKRKFGILHELKWNTVSRTHLAMYDEILRLFFKSSMVFRSILVKNKSNIQAHSLEHYEYNRFYYSVIEQLIQFSIQYNSDSANSYRIFLDLKDNNGKFKLASIHNVLTSMIGSNDKIQSLQNIRSHESQLIQLTDIIIGAITYKARGLNGSEAKSHIVNLIEDLSGYHLDEGTDPGDGKFAIYDFQPK